MVTQKRLHELFDYNSETGIFTWKVSNTPTVKVGDVAGTRRTTYIRIRVDGRKYQAHRLAWLYVYGVLPEEQVDHINRNPFDNSISNLRLAQGDQNSWNQGPRKTNRTGYKGVSVRTYSSGNTKFRAQITYKRKHVLLGLFDTAEEAARAYDAKARELYGEFVYLNFPSIQSQQAAPLEPQSHQISQAPCA